MSPVLPALPFVLAPHSLIGERAGVLWGSSAKAPPPKAPFLMTIAVVFRSAVSRHFGPVTAPVRAVDARGPDHCRGCEFFAMLGPSGSGKTTCLRLIAGFESAVSPATIRHVRGKRMSTHVPPLPAQR